MSKNIHEAILAIMGEVSYVQKERKQGVTYSIKSEEGVLNAIRPAMLNHGVVMFPVEVKDAYHSTYEAGKYKNLWNRVIATHIYRFVHAASETHVDVAVLGDGADMGDKAGNKSMTTSKKYALLETFLLKTGDDPDDTPSPTDSPIVKEAKKLGGKATWTPAQLKWAVDAKHAENEHSAKAALNHSIIPRNSKKVIVTSWMKHYRAGRDQDKEVIESAELANEAYRIAKEGK